MRTVSWVLVLGLAFGSTFNVGYVGGVLMERCEAGDIKKNGEVTTAQHTATATLTYYLNCQTKKIRFSIHTKTS